MRIFSIKLKTVKEGVQTEQTDKQKNRTNKIIQNSVG